MKSFGCMPAVRTPEASRTLTVSCPGILPSPLRDKVGAFHHDRFRGYVSVHSRSGLHPPCLRFAVAVAGHHARLGTRLLVRLCRGRHHRRLNSMRLQGATPTPPGIRVTYHGGSIGLGLQGRAFGCWLRHEWFGPLVIADRGFTRATYSKASEYWVFCRLPLMSCQSYLPLPIVRAFGHRSRLGLSVAPPFGLGVPH